MTDSDAVLAPLVDKLQLWQRLGDAERTALLALPHEVRDIAAHHSIVSEGERATHSCLLLDGYAFRHKVLIDGSRSILALHMKGDVVDLQNSLLGTADHGVQALTRCKVAYIPREAIKQVAVDFPQLGLAMWYDTLVDGSIFREWIANIARRNAPARIAHLLCEFGIRLESRGLARRSSFTLPMTQEQLADATGLTPVHVNRTLMSLEGRGLIARRNKSITIADWGRMEAEAGFDAMYLHLHDEPPLSGE